MPPGNDRLLAWSLGPGRGLAGVSALLDDFAQQLRGARVPLNRMTLSWQTLHPQALVAAYYWSPTQGISERAIPFGINLTSAYLNSPIRKIFEGEPEVRRRLGGPRAVMDFGVLSELKDQGIRDYFVLPIRFSDGLTNAMSFATTRATGFSQANLDAIKRGVLYLAPLLEILAERAIARTVLEVYLGRDTGLKVLEGSITRGNAETIDAALWFCDLRNFTGLSEALPTEKVVELLNDYFGVVGTAIEANGGEILKFIGDAVLAIFPLATRSRGRAACRAALKAAQQALAAKSELRVEGVQNLTIDFGIALHVGPVAYGNIGAPARLDFTVIGPAVNLVSRIAGLCGSLNRPILASRTFGSTLGQNLESIGKFELKGIEGREEVFALPEATAA